MSTRDLTIVGVMLAVFAVWWTRKPTAVDPAVPQGVQLLPPAPAGLAFMGGTPSFDERTGTYLPQRLLAFGPSVVQAPGNASVMMY